MTDRGTIVRRLGAPPRPRDVLEWQPGIVPAARLDKRALVLERCRCRECSKERYAPGMIRVTEDNSQWHWRSWDSMQQKGWMYAGHVEEFEWVKKSGHEILVPKSSGA